MTISIALLQFNILWENKKENLNLVKGYLDKVENIDLIVLPEMFTTGFSMNAETLAEEQLNTSEETLATLIELAKKHRTAIATSWITKKENKFYNTLHFITPEQEVKIYNKRKLFRPGKEDLTYTKGEENLVVQYKGFNIYFQICYDLRFPELARNYNLQYDIGINVANWPSIRSKQWKALISGRAVENQAYFIGVNRTGKDKNGLFYSGNSLVADFNGNVLTELLGENQLQIITLDKEPLQDYREKFPVYKDFYN